MISSSFFLPFHQSPDFGEHVHTGKRSFFCCTSL